MDDQRVSDEIDVELLRQLRDGNFVRAWAAIEQRHGKMMVATANAKLGFTQIDSGVGAVGAWSANDVVQQVLVELMKRGPALADSIRGPLGAYLRGAVRKRVLTAFDKQRDTPLDGDPISERTSTSDIADGVIDEMMLVEALQPLSERDRYVIVETVMHMRSNASVGRDLGLSGQGVGKIRKRVLAEIAACLGGDRA